jgi:ubiquitin-small subunit ribosomal protein S27Ae
MGIKKSNVKGKKQRKPSKSTRKADYYQNGIKNKRECPKCGVGVFMAEHKDRFHCGKCGFSEFKKLSSP